MWQELGCVIYCLTPSSHKTYEVHSHYVGEEIEVQRGWS